MTSRKPRLTPASSRSSHGHRDEAPPDAPRLLAHLHKAFPVGRLHVFLDGWIGAWDPTISSVVVDFPTGPVSSEVFECVYFDRPDLGRVRDVVDPDLKIRGYRIAIELPEPPGGRPRRAILLLQDGKRISQDLGDQYTTAMTVDDKLNYLRTSPYPVKPELLEDPEYLGSVLRLCANELAEEALKSVVTVHAEQICFGDAGVILVSGWMTDEGRLVGPTTVVDGATHQPFRASILRFQRKDLRDLGNGAVGFGLFVETNRRNLPSTLILECGDETYAEISTAAPIAFRQQSLSYSLAVLANYLTTGLTKGFDPKDHNQKYALEFIDGLKHRLYRPSAVESEHVWGEPPEAPDVSLVIPVYRSYHLIRSQLLDLSTDSYIQNQEIIYVLDSTEDKHWFETYMEQLWKLYRVPCRLLVMKSRSGFAGASNAGADSARASRLLFLNQDIFLDGPGGFKRMVETLDADTTVGCVGARLLFPDGSVQHVGMTWKHEPLFGGLRLNSHFYKGIDPAMVPFEGVVDVPTVTAACVLCRKDDFEAAGRFDEGFLWGDFEDSDLCLRIRQMGKRIVCNNDAVFIHAEGASYPSEERQASIAFNALRHEQKWHREIDAMLLDFALADSAHR